MTLQAPLSLGTGSVARYPLARKGAFITRTTKFADQSRQTFAQLNSPLSQWVIQMDLLTDAERSDWWNFHQSVQGAYAPFVFVDPSDNLLQFSEQQELLPWNFTGVIAAPDFGDADPFGLSIGRPRGLTVSPGSAISRRVYRRFGTRSKSGGLHERAEWPTSPSSAFFFPLTIFNLKI